MLRPGVNLHLTAEVPLGDSLRLVVRDDGRGITEAQAHGRSSLGLAGLRERARQLDGHTSVRAHPEGGTEVVALLPLPGR